MTIDNGQHVFLRCCTAYQELLARLGMTGSVAIQDRFDVTVLSQAGPARLRRTSLPSPLHFAGALAGYRLLSVPERARVARAALAFRFANPDSAALDRVRLGDWLAARGQGERARRRLWDLFVVSALNVAGDDASLQLAATVIKTALLGAKDAADIGMATVPLGELHATAAASLLDRLGVRVRLGSRVAAIERLASGGFRLRLAHGELATGGPEGAADGGAMLADGVVLAVPPAQAGRLAAGRPPAGTRLGWPRLFAHRQRARHLRPEGNGVAICRGGRLAGPVGLRQDKARPDCAAGNTWRCRYRPQTPSSTRQRPRSARCSCRHSSSCSRPPPGLASLTSS